MCTDGYVRQTFFSLLALQTMTDNVQSTDHNSDSFAYVCHVTWTSYSIFSANDLLTPTWTSYSIFSANDLLTLLALQTMTDNVQSTDHNSEKIDPCVFPALGKATQKFMTC